MRLRGLCLWMMAAACGCAVAGTPPPAAEIAASLGLMRMDYVEKDRNGLTPEGYLDSENGLLGSVRIESRGLLPLTGLPRPLELSGSLQFSGGDTTYDGHLQPPSLKPIRMTDTQRIADVELRVGMPLTLNETWRIVPLLSVGRHDWGRSGPGISEWYHHFWLGAGGDAVWTGLPGWRLRGGLVLAHTIAAGLDVNNGATELDLGGAAQVMASGEAEYFLNDRIGVFGRVGWQYFAYGRSPMVNKVYEPESASRLSTFLTGARWRF